MSGVSPPTAPHDDRAPRPGCQSMRSPPGCASSSRLSRPDETISSALAGTRPYIQPNSNAAKPGRDSSASAICRRASSTFCRGPITSPTNRSLRNASTSAGRRGVAREHVAKVGFVGETRPAPGDGVDHALGRGEAVRHDVEPTDGRAVAAHHPVTRSRDGDRRPLVIDCHRLQPAVCGAEGGQRAGQRRLERGARAHPEDEGQVAALAQIRIAAHHRQVVDHRRAEQLRERTLAQAQLRLVARRQVVVRALAHAGERGREPRVQPFAQLDEVRDAPEAHVVERRGRGGRQRLQRNRAAERRDHRRPGCGLNDGGFSSDSAHRRGFVRRGEQRPIGLQRLLQRRHPGRGVHQARQLGRVAPRHGHARRAARRCARN